MALAPPRSQALLGCDGFRVVTADAQLGVVEEVWLGEGDSPIGVALRAAGGERGLVLAEDVLAVEPDRRWVVVNPDARILELEPPRLLSTSERSGRIEAAWATTGGTIATASRSTRRFARPSRPRPDPPLLRSVLLLYAALAGVVGLVIALAFLVPYVVT